MILSRIAGGADRVLNVVEGVLLVSLLILSVAVLVVDIALRTFLNDALPWAAEATRYCIVWMVFIGGSTAARKGAHISIDALSETLPSTLGAWIARAALFLSAVSTAALAWFSWTLVVQMIAFNQRSPSLEIPMWVVYLALPIGFALMTFRFLQAAAQPRMADLHSAPVS